MGKSVVTVNLAVAMARRGQRCVLVDADLGGANLHTLLGVRKPDRTLSHYLNADIAKLSAVMCETPFPNLWLISGCDALLEMANPKYSQKQKLLRNLRHLDVDHVLLDLGAGSAFNVLDFFIEAQHQILVVVPEPTSIENTYHFLKAAFYRWLRKAAREFGVREAIERVLGEETRRRVRSPRELIEAVLRVDPVAGQALLERARAFSPMLVVNQTRTPEHRRVGWEISQACRDYLDMEVRYLGDLQRDDCVLEAVSQRQPVLHIAPHSPFSRDLEEIVLRLSELEALPPSHGTAR
ncbi:MAG: P-loop NTPase, partial [Myxococcota bacterium]